jgi:hypothetical protein
MPLPELVLELSASRPVSSPELRERVRALAAEAPAPRPRISLPSFGRLVLVAAAAALAVGLGVAVVHGVTRSGGPARHPTASGARGSIQRSPAATNNAGQGQFKTPLRAPRPLPFLQGRLQNYGASLQVQVEDREALSDATKRAMRFARLLGGYVASVRYSAPRSGVGGATVVVRVPVDRVQDAIDEYAGLGTLLRQKLAITDVTKAVEEEAREIARLRADIARLEAGGVTPAERPRLEAEQARLDYLTKRRQATVRRAQLARISLALTTKPKHAAASAGRFHRTLSDAGSILVREAELLLYALIVAGPLLVLGGAAIGGARLLERRRQAHLLERS